MEKNKIFTYDDMYNGALSLKQKLLDLSLSLPEDCDFIRGIKDSEFILKRFKEGNYPDFNSEEQKKYAHMCALFNFNTWIERVGGIETIKNTSLWNIYVFSLLQRAYPLFIQLVMTCQEN